MSNTVRNILMLLLAALAVFAPPLAYAAERGITLTQAGEGHTQVQYDARDNHALIIGIDRYRSWPKLECAVKDAQAIREIFEAEFGFRPENVRVLYDADATRDGILQVLRDYRKLPDTANLVIYYAGHGWLDPASGEGYWITVETDKEKPWNSIALSDLLNNYLKPLKVKHLSMFVDACFGGALLKTRGIDQSPFHAKKFSRKSRMALTSGNLETVPDATSGGHSLFNLKLQQYLRGKLPGSSRDYFTLTDIYSGIGSEVSRFSQTSQEPILGRINDPLDEKGEFVFYRKPKGVVILEGAAFEEQGSLRVWNQVVEVGSPDQIQKLFGELNFDIRFVAEFQSDGSLLGAEFAPQGDRVIAVSRQQLELREAADGKLVQTVPLPSPAEGYVFNGTQLILMTANRELIVANYDGTLAVAKSLKTRGKQPRCAALSARGVLAIGHAGGEVEVVDIARGVTAEYYDAHRKAVRGIGFTTDGKTLVTVGDDLLTKFWDARTYKEIKSLREPGDKLGAISLSNTSNLMAIGTKKITVDLVRNRRTDEHYLLVRDVLSGNEFSRIPLNGETSRICFFAVPRYITAAAPSGHLVVYDLSSGKEVYRLAERVDGFVFDRSGSRLLTYGKDIVRAYSVLTEH